MKKSSLVSIRNGIIVSILSGLFLLAVPNIKGYLSSFLSWIKSIVRFALNKVLISYHLPGLILFPLVILALVGAHYIYTRTKQNSDQCSYLDYVEDNIYGMKWRWQWVSNKIINLWCFCPRCGATLVYDESFVHVTNKTDFVCENCQRTVSSIEGGRKDYAIGAVTREIDRRIRTSEYEQN